MAVVARLSHLRIAPRKVRLLADLIRGKSVEEAQTILNFTVKRASLPLLKLLRSAVANAKNNFRLEEANLYIQKIFVDEGQKLKRWRPRARGQAYEIQKKTSHITIALGEIKEKSRKTKTAKERTEKPGTIERIREIPKAARPKFKPEIIEKRPRAKKGIMRMFRRKAF